MDISRIAPTPGCSCGHRRDQHDRIATRHCRATIDTGLRRGCICYPTPAPLGVVDPGIAGLALHLHARPMARA